MRMIKTPKGEFTDIFRQLYQELSVLNYPDVLHTDAKLESYVNTISTKLRNEPVKVVNSVKVLPKTLNKDKRVLLAFSGGKDSLAAAIKLKAQGYDLIFYHVLGMNPSYTNEWKSVKPIARRLGAEVQFARVAQSGDTDFNENPTKNALILAMMIDYGVKQGITNYAQGSATDDNLGNLDKLSSLSDAKELYMQLEEYYRQYIPNIEFFYPVVNNKDSYKTVIDTDVELLKFTASCMTPFRYQQSLRRSSSKKYDIRLTKGCGVSCFKCCQELMILEQEGYKELTPAVRAKCVEEFKKQDGDRYELSNWV